MSSNPPVEPDNGGPDNGGPTEDTPGARNPEASEPSDAGPSGADQPTTELEASPYDSEADATAVTREIGDGYGRAPNPSESPWASASKAAGDDGDEGGNGAGPRDAAGAGAYAPRRSERRSTSPMLWLILAVAAIALGVAIFFAIQVWGSDDDDSPTADPTATHEVTDEPTEDATEAPTEEPTGEPTGDVTDEPTEEPTEEPTGAGDPAEESELLRYLDVPVEIELGDEVIVFDADSDGFVEDSEAVDAGAVEAYRATFTDGDGTEIELFAAYFASNDEADEFAEQFIDGLDAELAETDDTYEDGSGTYWAFLFPDGSGSYVWTTDNGHVLQVVGSVSVIGSFYNNLRI